MSDQNTTSALAAAPAAVTDADVRPQVPSASNANAARPVGAGDALMADQEDDGDEAISSEDDSVLTQSVRSSVYDYKYENGRRYHAFKEGTYMFPNDDQEQERMDIQARAMMLASGQLLHHSPIKDPQRILDVGTGTGLWAVEMGEAYPGAEVFGVDLSPIQSTWVPPNVKFEVDDVEDNWTWPAEHFDLIFSKLMISGCITDLRRYLTQAYRCLKPGGWFEDHEMISRVDSDHIKLTEEEHPAKKWAGLMEQGIRRMGRRMDTTPEEIKEVMEDIGFINVVCLPFKVPVGTWPADKRLKEAGAAQLVVMLEGIQALSLAIFTRALGWSQEETEVFLMEARKSFKAKKQYLYWASYVVYGQKPENAAAT